ncbi:hypothetical protein [Bacillus pumilus]|uniref:hypothetical protein n=1 Tax=Bacillus pumilus TaxID=1408 RepID=UPI00273D186B|nr:hypothetical protein [Bacillus pumilus]MEB2357032.1 hypothetical protein [Bacillus pumilus]WLP60574.1 hypothetical protein Q8W18_04900 [Bacillus pumilus]
MLKKWSVLIFTVFLLAGCGEKAAETLTTEKTVSEKPATDKNKETATQDEITVEPMKLTKNEKNLQKSLSDESFEAMTVKGLKESVKSVSLIGMHYKDGQLLKEDTKKITMKLHQNGVDNSVKFIYQLEEKKDDLLNVTYSLWKDKEQSEQTKLATSVDFKQDVGGNTTITEANLFHMSPGEKKLISTTITTGMNYEFSGLTDSEKNLKEELKGVKQAYLVYLQLDK